MTRTASRITSLLVLLTMVSGMPLARHVCAVPITEAPVEQAEEHSSHHESDGPATEECEMFASCGLTVTVGRAEISAAAPAIDVCDIGRLQASYLAPTLLHDTPPPRA